jgi:drug/metabolite transporter (DMT)-like permease
MLIAATACWGVGTVVSKQVLDEDVAPLTLLTIQLASSCLFVAAMCRLQRARFDWSPRLRRLAALGVLNPGIAYALGLIGLSSITASLSVLLWAAEPVLILLFAAALLREHIPGAMAAALGAGVLGVVLVVYQPGPTGDAVGIALTLTAVAACALYAVLTRRLLLDDASLAVVLVQQVAALAFAVLITAVVHVARGDVSVDLPTGPIWITAAASGILYYGLAYWFFLSGLSNVPASYAGTFFPLIPVFGLAAGFVVGERLVGRQWIGVALIVGATATTAIRQAHREETRTSKIGD